MESLEERSIKVRKLQLKSLIKEYTEELDDLDEQLVSVRKRHFHGKWDQDAVDVLDAYTKLVDSCCYQGGPGYKIWVPVVSWACHWVVHPDKYAMCQPTQMDRDAYYAVLGKTMNVTTAVHGEHWGN